MACGDETTQRVLELTVPKGLAAGEVVQILSHQAAESLKSHPDRALPQGPLARLALRGEGAERVARRGQPREGRAHAVKGARARHCSITCGQRGWK